jgi:hypothetical protein
MEKLAANHHQIDGIAPQGKLTAGTSIFGMPSAAETFCTLLGHQQIWLAPRI